MTGSRRTGRRAGRPGTRETILAAARARFASDGYRASMRAVAADAGVDPALVHHYFGTKEQLFAAVAELPFDPEPVFRRIDTAPLSHLGTILVTSLLQVWDSPAGAAAVAVLRTVLSGEVSASRVFLLEVLLERVRRRIATREDDGRLRISLVASQMAGLLATRKIVRLPPLDSLPIPQLTAAVGPTIQRYLTGSLTPSETANQEGSI